jgi:hypothetical protein
MTHPALYLLLALSTGASRADLPAIDARVRAAMTETHARGYR